MKFRMFFRILAIAALATSSLYAYPVVPKSDNARNTVNAVLGDLSFLYHFGTAPTQTTDERVRIATHLEYVEALLRRADVSHLSPKLRTKRAFLLGKLHEYRIAERFPRNYSESEGRKPCFIDKHGNICAVGYLVECSAGRNLAERINTRHQYDLITAMNLPELTRWVRESGLTLEECAMIQPQYPSYQIFPAKPDIFYVASILATGVNTGLGVTNFQQIELGANNKIIPLLGFASGIGSIALGVAEISEEGMEINLLSGTRKITRANPISVLNIGIGAASIVLSAWNLLSDAPIAQTTSLNLYSAPMPQNQVSMGVQLVHKF